VWAKQVEAKALAKQPAGKGVERFNTPDKSAAKGVKA
jgi:hypothetical protein